MRDTATHRGPTHLRELRSDDVRNRIWRAQREQARPAYTGHIFVPERLRDESAEPEGLQVARLGHEHFFDQLAGVAGQRAAVGIDLRLRVVELEIVVRLRRSLPKLLERAERLVSATERKVAVGQQSPAPHVFGIFLQARRQCRHEARAFVRVLGCGGIPIADVLVEAKRHRHDRDRDRDGYPDADGRPLPAAQFHAPQRQYQNADRDGAQQRSKPPELRHAAGSSSSKGWRRRDRTIRQNTMPPITRNTNGPAHNAQVVCVTRGRYSTKSP